MDTLTFISQNEGSAIREAIRSGIPASIIMAQAILESDSGNSPLATQAKNLFGVKCHSDWSGATFYQSDDLPNECFRKYDSVKDSFRDHTKFLQDNSRYNSLFNLASDDWQGWADGLKKAGYATAANYSNALKSLISSLHLTFLDSKVKVHKIVRVLIFPVIMLILIIITLIVLHRMKQQQKIILDGR